jgi:RNA pol II accessory factor, Cdc73 family, C-terminal
MCMQIGKQDPEQDAVRLFDQLCGFYLHFKDTAVKDDVSKWKVKLLPIERSVRHNDVQTVNEFFRHLTSFLDDKYKDPAKKADAETLKLCCVDKLRYR